MKESSFIFLTVVLLLLAVKIRQARGLRLVLAYSVLFALILGAHTTLRSDTGFSWILLGCVLISFPLSVMGPRWRFLTLGLLPFAVGTVLLWLPGAAEKLCFVFYRHMGNVYQDQTSMTYSYLPPVLHASFRVTNLEEWAGFIRTDPLLLAQAIQRAVFHYLAEPLPDRTGNLFALLALPQMILWYILLLWAAVGMVVGLKRHAQGTPFLMTAALAWTIAGGLAAGNVGLVFRVRDMVTPLFLIFSSIGIQSCLPRRDHGAD